MTDTGPLEDQHVARFVSDPDKVGLVANRGDVADLIATIGLALTSHVNATWEAINGNDATARESVLTTLANLKKLAEECRTFVGQPEG